MLIYLDIFLWIFILMTLAPRIIILALSVAADNILFKINFFLNFSFMIFIDSLEKQCERRASRFLAPYKCIYLFILMCHRGNYCT